MFKISKSFLILQFLILEFNFKLICKWCTRMMNKWRQKSLFLYNEKIFAVGDCGWVCVGGCELVSRYVCLLAKIDHKLNENMLCL